MNHLDDQAWDREFDHVENKQKKETIVFSGGHSYEIADTQDKEKPQSTAN